MSAKSMTRQTLSSKLLMVRRLRFAQRKMCLEMQLQEEIRNGPKTVVTAVTFVTA